ncbi:VanZ family protein [Georgenia sp. SYP-B2076]|uniref:VanZ family protein n=1 Tax=Georgenia sp. SYP-B2076 TaxID=2495881 RepID=UPI000F8DABB6|nr:VanZ family protein [Georgenia sp. SYP-B2076]
MTAARAPGPRAAAGRRGPLLALAVALVVQLVVLYLPEVPSAGTGVPGVDKVVHAAVFGAVTVAGLRAGLRARLVVGFGLAHAVVSELVQHLLLAGRSGDPLDVVADVAGVALGWVLARRLARRPARRAGAAPAAGGAGAPGGLSPGGGR